MGQCVNAQKEASWSSVFTSEKSSAALEKLFDSFDRQKTGVLDKNQIKNFIETFLTKAKNEQYYLYKLPLARRFASAVPKEKRILRTSYDVLFDLLDNEPQKLIEISIENLGQKGADCILKEDFLKNAPQMFHVPSSLQSFKEMDEIRTNLFLGSQIAAKDKKLLKKVGITHIVNISFNTPCYHPDDFTYLHHCEKHDSANQLILDLFKETHLFLEEAFIEKNTKILIHCEYGVSRSASLVMSFIMRNTELTFREVYDLVRGRRGFVNPNAGFQSQLLEFERQNYSLDFPCYRDFSVQETMKGLMVENFAELEAINCECEDDDFERCERVQYHTLFFVSVQDFEDQDYGMRVLLDKAVEQLRHFQTEYIQCEQSLKTFDEMFPREHYKKRKHRMMSYLKPLIPEMFSDSSITSRSVSNHQNSI